MKIANRIICLTLVCAFNLMLLFQSNCFAAEKKKYSKVTIKPSFEEPFDPSIETLPIKFRGNSFIDILVALFKKEKIYIKGEFETSEQHKAKMDTLIESTLLNKLNYGSTIAFVVPYNYKAVYDANNGVLNVDINTSYVGTDKISGNAVEISHKLDKTSKYTGQNALGKKAKVTLREYITHGLVISEDIPNLKITMAVDEAKKAKTSGSLILIGNLSPPFYGFYYSHKNATLTDPEEVETAGYYIAMGLKEIWYANLNTGEIYYKKKIAN